MATKDFITNKIPLGLYIHIPWCVKKCPYCDFNSHTLKTELPPAKEYIAALEQNMLSYKNLVKNRSISTIFFGGGTPSIFSGANIEAILNLVTKHFSLTDDVEITLEANPGTVEQQKFSDFKTAGVNRISIGVQSFSPQMLKKLGRIHSDMEAQNAIKSAQQAGFDNINIDIMYGLPGQISAESNNDLEIALSFQTPHLSWYQLTIEPNTAFYHKKPITPKDDKLFKIEDEGKNILYKHGMQQYEISAWSNGKLAQCKHNYNIWQYGDYLGIGAGACGKITQNSNIIRTMQTKHPKMFIDAKNSINDKIVAPDDIIFEFMLNHLRLNQVLEFSLFEERTNLPRELLFSKLDKLPQHSAKYNSDCLELTPKGYSFYNDMAAVFLP
ncbi:MAG: radical SAM family heme chaperone HemW [Legionellales bacterium]|jgi:putative oxygen-independent coproporphyrinogen III oxidase|nr:radical SAM family heme chaperone HemW [Legionellales bacterium]